MKQVVLPELGEGIETATIAAWNVKKGDLVKKEDDIVELVTDKASFSVSAGFDGRVIELQFQEGEEVAIGETLAVIDEENKKGFL